MKQHITYKEFYDLTEEMKEKLLLAIERLDLMIIDFGTNNKLFTIGKMIEILKQNCQVIEIYNDYDINCDNPVEWWVVEHSFNDTIIEKQNVNLCDALFESVKEVL